MNLRILLEQRMMRLPDGSTWSSGEFGRAFWNRYLDVFTSVRVCARVKSVDVAQDDWLRVDGDAVDVAPLPYYLGPWDYLRHRRQVRQCVLSIVKDAEALMLRVPSHIAWQSHALLCETRRPYAVEVAGDPWDVFAAGSVHSIGRPFFRRLFAARLKRQCAGAAAALYVTEQALQHRYPPGRGVFTVHASNVNLPEEAIVSEPRRFKGGGPTRLVFAGSLEQMYKGPDVLIHAAAILGRRGHEIRVTLLGDGRHRADMEALSVSLGLGDRVWLPGAVAVGGPVREQLDRADLFVMPSRTEGLPRALIEAMARGLPCIGSAIGGIPELLHPEDLVSPGNARMLADVIEAVITDSERMARMSKRNLEKSKTYRNSVLANRRRAFYRTLRDKTAAWQEKRVS